MTARIDGDEILIDPPLPEAKELGARWDKRRSVFALPATRMNAYAVQEAVPGSPPGLADGLGPSPSLLVDVPTAFFPYQTAAVSRLASATRGQLVVLSPGLGKSAVAIAAADSLPKGTGVLVICPASLEKTWWREIEKWGRANRCEWAVETWDRAARLAEYGGGRHGGGLGQWGVVILDESVMAKSRQTRRYKSLSKVRQHWKRVWLLSGSPVTRYADDLWTQLHLIWPVAYPSYWRFARRYCIVEETPWGDKVTGTRTSRDVMKENDDLIIVVNQEDVLDLPEYLFEVVDVDLGRKQAAAYRSMEKAFIAELGNGDEVIAQNELARLGKLQQIASWWDGESAKHDALLDLLPTYEAPHLIWTHWRDGANALTNRLADAGYSVTHVDGALSHAKRDEYLEEFKRGEMDVLVLSIGVGKFGHTFTNARTVHYVDKTWNADDYFQSLRRVRRIGLEHRPVVVTYRAPGTTDELVEANLEGKLGGISRLTRSDLKELLAGLGKGG